MIILNTTQTLINLDDYLHNKEYTKFTYYAVKDLIRFIKQEDYGYSLSDAIEEMYTSPDYIVPDTVVTEQFTAFGEDSKQALLNLLILGTISNLSAYDDLETLYDISEDNAIKAINTLIMNYAVFEEVDFKQKLMSTVQNYYESSTFLQILDQVVADIQMQMLNQAKTGYTSLHMSFNRLCENIIDYLQYSPNTNTRDNEAYKLKENNANIIIAYLTHKFENIGFKNVKASEIDTYARHDLNNVILFALNRDGLVIDFTNLANIK